MSTRANRLMKALNSHPPDRGCPISPSCLSCPLPQCIHEMNGTTAHLLLIERVRSYAAEHQDMTQGQVAAALSLSRRAVNRLLAEA